MVWQTDNLCRPVCHLLQHRIGYIAQDLVHLGDELGQLGVGLHQAEDVSLRGVGVVTQEEVRRREVEEGQGVGLDDLAVVQEPPQADGGVGDLHREDLVAVHNHTVVTIADLGDRYNKFGPVLDKYEIPKKYNYKPEDMTWIEYTPQAEMLVLNRILANRSWIWSRRRRLILLR